MSDLLTMLREHDLPPRWDGLAVVWEGWQYAPPVHWCSARLVRDEAIRLALAELKDAS